VAHRDAFWAILQALPLSFKRLHFLSSLTGPDLAGSSCKPSRFPLLAYQVDQIRTKIDRNRSKIA